VSELTDLIEKLKKLREAGERGPVDGSARGTFIVAAANDAIPLLTACQSEIKRLERQLEATTQLMWECWQVVRGDMSESPGATEQLTPLNQRVEDYFAQSQKG
jgi:hypothetical protein